MLPYRIKALNMSTGRTLKCQRCLMWIGSVNPALGRLDYYFTHCEICKDTLCEKCSMHYAESPVDRINQLMDIPAVNLDWAHWANRLNNASRHGTQNLRSVHEIVDIHRNGREKWRHRYMGVKEMRKISSSPTCYVPDAFPYTRRELEREKADDENHFYTKNWTTGGW